MIEWHDDCTMSGDALSRMYTCKFTRSSGLCLIDLCGLGVVWAMKRDQK